MNSATTVDGKPPKLEEFGQLQAYVALIFANSQVLHKVVTVKNLELLFTVCSFRTTADGS